MMHESKGHVLAKPHPYIFFILQLVHESFLELSHTYTSDVLHMLLDHINIAPKPCRRKKVAWG